MLDTYVCKPKETELHPLLCVKPVKADMTCKIKASQPKMGNLLFKLVGDRRADAH